MKRITILIILCALIANDSEAQLLNKIRRKAKQKIGEVEDKVVNDIFEGPTNKNKKGKQTSKDDETVNQGGPVITPKTSKKKEIKLWLKRYDFVPGQDILFYDDFEKEPFGEIPSKWKYKKGTLEVAKMDGDHGHVITGGFGFTEPNWRGDDKLPEQFTLEFDVYLEDYANRGKTFGSYGYKINLLDERGRAAGAVYVGHGTMSLHNIVSGKLPNASPQELSNAWHHISISVNKNSVKGYFNEYRMFNGRLGEDARISNFSLWNCCQTTDEKVFFMDNVKVAAGSHKNNVQEFVDGKFVSNNILFETGSAELLARSYVEISRVASMIKGTQDKKYSIEGHTDDVGKDADNINLSKNRAEAVKEALVDMGIDASRLNTIGHGEAQPLGTNDTPEGRAMNRRVEFIEK